MKKRTFLKVVSLMTCVFVLVSTVAFAGTASLATNNLILMKDAIQFDKASFRWGSNAGNSGMTAWPASDAYADIAGYMLDDLGGKASELIGDSDNLYFADPESVYDNYDFLNDENRTLTTMAMTEWNGFLFVIAKGYGVSTVSYKSGSTTVTYNGRTNSSVNDSYLYIFDISEGKNWKDCIYGAWSFEELGIASADKPLLYGEAIEVTDKFIIIESYNANDGKYASILDNNVKRGDEGTMPENVTDSVAGGYAFIESSAVGFASTSTDMVGDFRIARRRDTRRPVWDLKSDSVIMTAVDYKNAPAVGETYFYSGTGVADQKVKPLSEVLDPAVVTDGRLASWDEAEQVQINDIVFDGNTAYMSVVYYIPGFEAGSCKGVFNSACVVDFSDALNPVILGAYPFPTNADSTQLNTVGTIGYGDGNIYITNAYFLVSKSVTDEAKAMGYTALHYDPVSGKDSFIYKGEKYFTAAYRSMYGTLKLSVTKNVDGTVSMEWDPRHQTSMDGTFGRSYFIPTSGVSNIVPVGHLVFGFVPGQSQVHAFLMRPEGYAAPNFYDAKMGVANEARWGHTDGGNSVHVDHPSIDYTNTNAADYTIDPVVYKSRIYTAINSSIVGGVQVFNFAKTAPVTLTMNAVSPTVTAPYTITGTAYNANSVYVSFNDGEYYKADTKKNSDGTLTWSYTLYEPGMGAKLSAKAAVFEDTPIDNTEEYTYINVVSSSNDGVTVDYAHSVEGSTVSVTPTVTNTQANPISAVTVVSLFDETGKLVASTVADVQYAEGNGTASDLETIEVQIPDTSKTYTAKVHMFFDLEHIVPITDEVTFSTK